MASYDVVVIGSGIGGLVVAGLLACCCTESEIVPCPVSVSPPLPPPVFFAPTAWLA